MARRGPIVLVFLAFVLLAGFRAWPWLAEPELRAEDAVVFFREAREDGTGAIGRPHNGYLHLLPRLIAACDSALSPEQTPRRYVFASFLLFLGLGALLLRPGMLAHRVPLALLILPLMPQDGTVIGHLADLGGVAALALLPLALRSGEDSWRRLAGDGLVFILAALSGPQILFFLPALMVLAAWCRRRRPVVFAALALPLAWLQARELPTARVAAGGPIDPGALLQALGARGPGGLLALDPSATSPAAGLALGVLGLAILALLGLLVVRRRAGPAAILLGGALGLLGATLWAYRGEPRLLLENPLDRYAFVTQALFCWTLLELPEGRRERRLIGVGLTLVLVAASGRQLARAPEPIRIGGWREAVAILEGPLPARLPVEPGWLLDHRPAAPPEDWPARSRALAFPDRRVEIHGADPGILSLIGPRPAILLADDSVILLDEGPVEATLLPRAGRPGRDDEVELVVDELDAEGRLRRLDALRLRPLRDHARLLPWRPRLDRPAAGSRLVLRCESRGSGRWYHLWGISRPLTLGPASAK